MKIDEDVPITIPNLGKRLPRLLTDYQFHRLIRGHARLDL
jgi:hypothetical protein